mmetsp:Transcript_3962/g.6636  ORF Transcript_3962/g.6636 Transcript_3962/m.6636 type:complete len:292 (+) Transcript_3962:91-966(+)
MKIVAVQLVLLMAVSSSAFTALPATCITSADSYHKLPADKSRSVLFAEKPGSARFTGIQQQDATSGFDLVLRAIVSDVGSIAVGLIGLVIAVGYRLADQDSLTVDTLGQETRTDLLAVFACGAVLLNGVSKLDVTSALADSVVLDGIDLEKPEYLSSKYATDLPWALESLLTATPANSAVLLEYDGNAWKTIASAGSVPSNEDMRRGPFQDTNPILDRFLKDGTSKETYLPTLQAIPGRVEFTYLPPNTQGALMLPVSSTQVMVLGSNTAKSFSPRDVAWSQLIATRIGAS